MEMLERGCGYRVEDGIYFETGSSKDGKPVEFFLICKPLPVIEGKHVPNQVHLIESPSGICHAAIWVGEEHYQYVPDFVEEVRRFAGAGLAGVSRRIPHTFPFERLTPGKSKMILAHSRARNTLWDKQAPPDFCPKTIMAHVETWEPGAGSKAERETEAILRAAWGGESNLATLEANTGSPKEGPCLGKLWELMPPPPDFDGSFIPKRVLPSFSYAYLPAKEEDIRLEPGIFAAFPINRIVAITQKSSSGKREKGRKGKEVEKRLNDSKFRKHFDFVDE